jgi:hypothetical protein
MWALISAVRKTAPSVVFVNIVINLAFFLTHPIFTPTILMPLAMLSLWTLLFFSWMIARCSYCRRLG